MVFNSKILIIGLILLSICQQSLAQVDRQVKFSFEGNKIFSSEELLNVHNKCLNRIQGNDPESFDSLFDRNNDYCSKNVVRNFMFDRGFLTARIGDAKKEETENGLQIVFSVAEGNQYSLGEIKIDGEKHFSERNILKTFPLKKGEILNASLIHKWISKLEDFYADQGFAQFSCEPEPTFIGNTVNLKFFIDEGRLFKVKNVKFVTNTNLISNYLRRYLTFDEGEVFSKQKLKETVEKINSLNKFQHIDSDKDIDIKLDEEVTSVTLTIHIKKKEK